MTNSKQQSSLHLNSILAKHGQAFFFSLGKLWRQPLTNIMTIAVIGIALALPATLFILLQNTQALSASWHDQTQISLFLKSSLSNDAIASLQKELQANNAISNVTYISPEQGLKQFEKQSGSGDVLQQLNVNPLPGVLEVTPSNNLNSPLQIQTLVSQLKQLPEVDFAQLNMNWVKRLFGIIALGQVLVWGLTLLLAVAVILIVGNTIRLSLQNHKNEIEITKLVGGTDAFVRRPFLYTGVFYGFFGALMAFILVSIFLISLSNPINHLSLLYQSSFYLTGFTLFSAEMLFIIGMMLGLVGAWFAVGRELRKIEPS